MNENRLILSDRYIEQKYFKKIKEPLNSIQGKPKIYKLKGDNIINKNLTIDNNINNLTNSIDNIISHDETILPTVINKYNPYNEENKAINEIEKGELEKVPENILKEYDDIVKVLGEENMQKIFSKDYLWKEEGLNILFEKLEDIIQNNNKNYVKIINLLFKLCMLLLEDNHPSTVIKIFEVIKKLFNYMNDMKIKLKLDKNITDGILHTIKKKLSDINTKVRTKAVLLYSFLFALNIFNFYNLLEEMIKIDDNNNTNIIFSKLDILINILYSNDQSIKKKISDKKNFPFLLIFEYLMNNLQNNNINNKIRKKSRYCIKLFFDIYNDMDKFIKYFDKISEKELDELIKDIPKLQNYFPSHKIINIEEYNKKNDNNMKEYKIKMNTSKKINKLLFKNNRSFSLRNKEKLKNQ